jgi:hypothetical protein
MTVPGGIKKARGKAGPKQSFRRAGGIRESGLVPEVRVFPAVVPVPVMRVVDTAIGRGAGRIRGRRWVGREYRAGEQEDSQEWNQSSKHANPPHSGRILRIYGDGLSEPASAESTGARMIASRIFASGASSCSLTAPS